MAELEDDPDTAEIMKRRARVRFRIHHHAIGPIGFGLVMVEHDGVHPTAFKIDNLFRG